jgi:hypothetical protein
MTATTSQHIALDQRPTVPALIVAVLTKLRDVNRWERAMAPAANARGEACVYHVSAACCAIGWTVPRPPEQTVADRRAMNSKTPRQLLHDTYRGTAVDDMLHQYFEPLEILRSFHDWTMGTDQHNEALDRLSQQWSVDLTAFRLGGT